MARVANAELIADILAVYRKHGWELRRALLTPESANELEQDSAALFGDAPVFEFGKDAVWFSRRSGKDGEAWEIRLLSATPFALIDVFEADQDDDAREAIRHGMEQKLLETVPKKIDVGHLS